ncbi:phosphoribosylamine--glycine ligase [Lutimonas zeaxanthinifaciens]|uniref:phosphoribosylamine--glycine ligase n=1 Tax=Lutimonas zeaxanthinifaciens TaxID=3060215 RepID=UPI00265CF532|nr:phosphoribosylamine--glycine ligase [Lutimonas sp. YSD2104]WKK66059.1 phosphoribosylamine--glycine ligase [Lutimonas sp. YSD2104]
MNILVLGSGGRECTIAWKLAQSAQCGNLFVAPGNAGTIKYAKNIDLNPNDFVAVKNAVIENNVQMVVVGPEDPLVNGIHDFFLDDEHLKLVPVIGPQKYAAQLEGSKEFAKEFMYRHDIPTAQYQSFTVDSLKEGQEFLETLQPPYVLKADGLAAGKGVLILDDLNEAKSELEEMLGHKKFGAASSKVVIEEFLDGIEMSSFVLTDSENYVILPNAKDYKRIGEGDVGLNTGGMGAVSPVPFADEEFLSKVENRVIKPTIEGLKKDNIPYVGFIFIGLIRVNNEPYVIEYNVRMGDPETEVVIPRIQSDLVELFRATTEKRLDEFDLNIDGRSATTVMLVSGGYPEAYEKGKEIKGLEEIDNSIVFHAGTKLSEDKVITSGGRVLAVTSYGADFRSALKQSYDNIDKIHFDKMNYRKDIGFDL